MNPRSANLKPVVWVEVSDRNPEGLEVDGVTGVLTTPVRCVAYGYTFQEALYLAHSRLSYMRQTLDNKKLWAIAEQIKAGELDDQSAGRLSWWLSGTQDVAEAVVGSLIACFEPSVKQAKPHVGSESVAVAPTLMASLLSIHKTHPVMHDIAQELLRRMRHGFIEYGTLLKTHNGRSAVQDLREELLDGLQYTMQAVMESQTQEQLSELALMIDRFHTLMLQLVATKGAIEPDERPGVQQVDFASGFLMDVYVARQRQLREPVLMSDADRGIDAWVGLIGAHLGSILLAPADDKVGSTGYGLLINAGALVLAFAETKSDKNAQLAYRVRAGDMTEYGDADQ